MSTSGTKRNNDINLSVKVKDFRYPINVNIGDKDSFTLYFNPGDPFVLTYADNLSNLDAPEVNENNTGEFLSFTGRIEKNLDAIFGDGAARQVFRYDGADHALFLALLDKVREGYEDFNERAKAAEKAARAQAIIDAKREAAPFRAPGQ